MATDKLKTLSYSVYAGMLAEKCTVETSVRATHVSEWTKQK